MRFGFSIRGLLWLTLVVAVSAEWWVDHGQLSKRVNELSSPYYRRLEFGDPIPWNPMHRNISTGTATKMVQGLTPG